MSIAENIQSIKSKLPDTVKLVAVSKTKPVEDIMSAYDTGQRIFGENKVQELQKKYEVLPKDIEWHMIGHMQSNKVKYIAPFVSLVHGVDSLKLLNVINKEGIKNNRVIPCLLQVHIANEETKFGFDEKEVIELVNSGELGELKSVDIHGVMGMATYTDDENIIRGEFRRLKEIFEKLKLSVFKEKESFSTISMGMSDDYRIAIEEGSTMVRIGSSIFGVRNYN